MREFLRLCCLVALCICLHLMVSPSRAEARMGFRRAPQGIAFDHRTGQFLTAPSLRLRDGEVFFIQIHNTSPADFIYEVKGKERETSTDSNEAGSLRRSLVTMTLAVRHESRFGGYILRISSRTGAPVPISDTEDLQTFDNLEIPVETLEWANEVAGAFTVSDLTDPSYSLQARQVDGEEQMFIVRDRDAEDNTKLGIGAFVHLYHTRVRPLALSFGIGINEDNKTTYFLGPSWRWGGQGALTAGVAFGSIARLPSGARENERATDTNVLNQLGSRTVNRVFISFSYSFLGNFRDRLEKPFAPAGDSSSGGGANTGNQVRNLQREEPPPVDETEGGDNPTEVPPPNPQPPSESPSQPSPPPPAG